MIVMCSINSIPYTFRKLTLVRLPNDEAHIGLFAEEQCIRAILRFTVAREPDVNLVLWK